MRRLVSFVGTAIVLMVLMVGCGSEHNTPTTATSPSATATTTTLQGTVADNNGNSGSIIVTVDSAVAAVPRTVEVAETWYNMRLIGRAEAATSTVTATAVLTFAGQTALSLSGTFDTSSGALSLSGSGLTLSGTINSSGAMAGTFSGTASGSFAGLSTAGGATVTSYCGTFSTNCGTPCCDFGTFNVTVSSVGTFTGYSINQNMSGHSVTLSGSVSGSTFTGTTSDNVSLSGNITATSISGTSSGGNSNCSGSFTGSSSACQ